MDSEKISNNQMLSMEQFAEDIVNYIQRMPKNRWASDVYEKKKKIPRGARPIFPYRTGNMRQNGTVAAGVSHNVAEIRIGGDKAPYAVYTEYPWISPRWNGRKNPNEGWIENLTKYRIAQYIRLNYKLGRLPSEDEIYDI